MADDVSGCSSSVDDVIAPALLMAVIDSAARSRRKRGRDVSVESSLTLKPSCDVTRLRGSVLLLDWGMRDGFGGTCGGGDLS